jgi:hypothetical protein
MVHRNKRLGCGLPGASPPFVEDAIVLGAGWGGVLFLSLSLFFFFFFLSSAPFVI